MNLLWYEIKGEQDKILAAKTEEYARTFTVHGLTKVVKGTRFESFFWSMILVSGISLCLVVLHGLVTKYQARAIYTEITSHITERNYFPSLTICEKNLLIDSYYAYCNKPLRFHNMSDVKYCRRKNDAIPANITETKNTWSNGLFTVIWCKTFKGDCSNKKYIKSHSLLNHSCITWNYNGDLYDIHSLALLRFEFEAPPYLGLSQPEIILIPHDSRIHEVDLTAKINVDPLNKYEIKLDKTIVKRLPAPFPSNCTDTQGYNIFPGKYSRHTCLESHSYTNMFKTCGDVPDYIQRFLPDGIRRKYSKNITIPDMIKCMRNFSNHEWKTNADCRFPCEEYDYSIVSNILQDADLTIPPHSNTFWQLSIRFRYIDIYKVMEEKQIFTWNQIICDIGGLVGIIIGMSVLSLVEIVVYICMRILRWVVLWL